jgi:RecB family endonuclease NucS
LRLEKLLVHQLDVLGSELLPIGRQVVTPSGKRTDILAVDPAGDLYIIELKRDRTPREAIAQLLDYGSWAANLTHEDLLAIYNTGNPQVPFEKLPSAPGVKTANMGAARDE